MRAVGYAPKGSRGEPPQMVLIADLAADDEQSCADAAERMIARAKKRDADGFVAISAEARKTFWVDRSRIAAIAAHTNAFKINEDVVIPLGGLAEYSESIERINIVQSLRNKLCLLNELREHFQGPLPELKARPDYLDREDLLASAEGGSILQQKRARAIEHLNNVGDRWHAILDNMDGDAAAMDARLDGTARADRREGDTVAGLLLRRALRISYRAVGLAGTRDTVPDGDIKQRPRHTRDLSSIPAQVIHFVKKPMPGNLPNKPMRALLGVEDARHVPILRDPDKVSDDSDAVFYFPGCGSERLFSQIGLATLAMLYDAGAQTVLPPGYLCCGYPQTSNGDIDKGREITTENRVLFHRVANTLNYMDIKTVIVSCGTCMDQLLKYEFERIFPGCRLLDIHEYLMEKGYKLDGVDGVQYMYHDPCHTPMKTHQPTKVASTLMGKEVPLNDRCCGEAGTFAVSRPDIATQARFRKEEEMNKGLEGPTGQPTTEKGKVKMLTSCPACLQGLSRYEQDTGVEADYIVVEMAKHLLGDEWQTGFIERAQREGVEKVLL